MKDTIQTARDTVTDLSRQGANKIILLSHLGFPADQDLATKVEGIDVIVSGHTDTLMGDPAILDASLGEPASPYPAVVKAPGGGKTLIVHAFCWGRLLGRLNLVFDSKGEITGWDGEPIFVDKNITDDPVVAQKLAELRPIVDSIIGKTFVDLDGRRTTVRNQESNLGNLVADAVLWSTSQDKTQIALVNGGGIRASIPVGDITIAQVLEALPFGNCLVQFDLTGAEVVAALENGLSTIEADPEKSGGRFLQVSGIKFSADLKKSAGSRVTEVMVGTPASGYQPLDKTAVYRIVTLDFMFNGGDGYTMLQNGQDLRGVDVPQEMVLIDYLKAHSPVNPQLEDRITLIMP
jgi:5'-nucleotidase